MGAEETPKKRLRALQKSKDNSLCADCPERRSGWVSMIKPPREAPRGAEDMGVFLCNSCALLHKRLGNDICVVRSIDLDDCE